MSDIDHTMSSAQAPIPLRFRKSDYPLILLHKLGIFDAARISMPNVLTVLNYHRIDNPHRTGFNTFRPNVSATPEMFARQMDYLVQKYRVISGSELVAFIKHKSKLPPNAALITFDDGYLDNYTNAYPILKARNLPAIIFLATDYIGTNKPFYWDWVANCFYHTRRDGAELPNLGLQTWKNAAMREKVMLRWIETLKKLPESEKQIILNRLPEILEVNINESIFTGLMISWDQARAMSEHGIEMGGHTASHPILTRISLDDVTMELSKSKGRIEEELGKPILSFAYPNGQSTDFNTEIVARAIGVGYKAAFTLLPGPTRYSTVLDRPFEIRRVFLGHDDNFSRFVAKLTGIPRVISRW
jgi:peptidoglycan/xylan/chitin deacetylase (PgdA/CDA1 family)